MPIFANNIIVNGKETKQEEVNPLVPLEEVSLVAKTIREESKMSNKLTKQSFYHQDMFSIDFENYK